MTSVVPVAPSMPDPVGGTPSDRISPPPKIPTNPRVGETLASVSPDVVEPPVLIGETDQADSASADLPPEEKPEPNPPVAHVEETPSVKGDGYVIQLTATGSKSKADAIKKPLLADNYNVEVIPFVNGEGKTLYRVQVVGYSDRASAEKAQKKMMLRYTQHKYIKDSIIGKR